MSSAGLSGSAPHGMTGDGPVRVWRAANKRAWVWSCDVHPRHRGYHHRSNRIDWILASQRKPPRPHPWLRAMAGAVRHWHEHHDPRGPCDCCAHGRAPAGVGVPPGPASRT